MRIVAGAAILAVLAVLAGKAISAQDKYAVQVPNGIALSDFRGYEDWVPVAVSHTEDPAVIKVIAANPVMIAAYRSGIPGNGQPFHEGSKIAKIEWNPKKSTEAPFSVWVPDTFRDLFLIEKDSKRFPDSNGWGYAQFNYDRASDSFTPDGSGTNCGHACHTIVKSKDYIFTSYLKR